MSGNSKQHYLVEFAARNARSFLPTFNAFSAVWRLRSLISDAEMLRDLREQAKSNDVGFGNRRSTYEIFDYFAVGFATCLEWHARTRIVDLLHFVPSCIEPTDVRTIDKAALSQMSAEKVTLPDIVGAGTKVSSIEEYVGIFRRIFDGLAIRDVTPEGLLRSIPAEGPPWRVPEPTNAHTELSELFLTRNTLVHEVGPNVIAHFSLRDIWTPEEALRVGAIALAAIEAVERVITDRTPKDFPNRIDVANGLPEDELEKLSSDILSLENEITTKLGEDEWSNGKGWQTALERSRNAIASEMEFLNQAGFLRPVRHIDFTRATQVEVMRARMLYLKVLLSHLNETLGV